MRETHPTVPPDAPAANPGSTVPPTVDATVGGSPRAEVVRPAAAATTPSRIGPYRLVRKLGEGGMGSVWEAVHTRLEKRVAVKLLAPHLLSRPEAVVRFEREMQAAGRVSHPNVVPAFDAGVVDGVHYLAMEYVDGVDLSRLVAKRGPLSVPQACRVVRQAALGLAAAHTQGLVHRDVKPLNLLLSKEGKVKVLDLGLARLTEYAAEASAAGLTAAGQVMGTPDYMAPEQWEDTRLAGPAADLYALGCTLYYLLVGRAPFATEEFATVARKMWAHTSEPPPDLAAARPDAPPELCDLYRRLLSKRPEDRPASGTELAAALAPFAGSRSKEEPPRPAAVPAAGATVERLEGMLAALPTDDSRSKAKRRRLVVGSVMAALLVLGLGGAYLARSGTGGRSEHDAASRSTAAETAAVSDAAEEGDVTKSQAAPSKRYALAFDGRKTVVALPTLRYDGSHPITIEATVRPEKEGGAILADTEYAGIRLGLNGVIVHDGSDYVEAAPATLTAVGEWVNLAAVFDGDRVSYFRDGKHQQTKPFTGRYKRSPLAMMIGANPTWNNKPASKFAGQMRQLRVSRVARYSGDYEPAEFLDADIDTVALYRFDEGKGAVLRDAAGGDHNGIINQPVWVPLADEQ